MANNREAGTAPRKKARVEATQVARAKSSSKRTLNMLIEMAKAGAVYSPHLAKLYKNAPSDVVKETLLREALEKKAISFKGKTPTKAEIEQTRAATETARELDGISADNIVSVPRQRKRRRSCLPGLGDKQDYIFEGDEEQKDDDSDASDLEEVYEC